MRYRSRKPRAARRCSRKPQAQSTRGAMIQEGNVSSKGMSSNQVDTAPEENNLHKSLYEIMLQTMRCSQLMGWLNAHSVWKSTQRETAC
jgi:hypothetical protein